MSKLNTIAIATLSALLFAGAAQAQAGKTRADVIAELEAAQASGALTAQNLRMEGVGDLAAAPRAAKADSAVATGKTPAPRQGEAQAAQPAAAKTRAEVIAELQRARESGELAALQSEGGPSHFPVEMGRVHGDTRLAGEASRKNAR